jgi:hypothetical protein
VRWQHRRREHLPHQRGLTNLPWAGEHLDEHSGLPDTLQQQIEQRSTELWQDHVHILLMIPSKVTHDRE